MRVGRWAFKERRGNGRYRSSDAFSSRTPSLMASPRRARARQRMLVVFPVPGGPWCMRSSRLKTVSDARNSHGRPERTRAYRNDNVGHVALARNHLQTRDRLLVADRILEVDRPILFDPVPVSATGGALRLGWASRAHTTHDARRGTVGLVRGAAAITLGPARAPTGHILHADEKSFSTSSSSRPPLLPLRVRGASSSSSSVPPSHIAQHLLLLLYFLCLVTLEAFLPSLLIVKPIVAQALLLAHLIVLFVLTLPSAFNPSSSLPFPPPSIPPPPPPYPSLRLQSLLLLFLLAATPAYHGTSDRSAPSAALPAIVAFSRQNFLNWTTGRGQGGGRGRRRTRD